MRVALASILCEKGDVEANLARHIAVLEGADRSGCDLAVFPEMSLTGSVDALAPEHAISIDHPAVNELIDEAGRLHVAVLFGLAERSAGGVHITQAYAHHRGLRGIQRKRHLGAGEDGFVVGADAMACELGAARFATVICAEANTPTAWDASASSCSGGAVFYCSAPGLDVRRTDDEAGWNDCIGWWEGHGLGGAQRHAARLGVWVGMATQAGATADEDFPGISALVSPGGEVVERLPAGEPGVLTVDIPMPVDVEPVRHSIRVLVIDGAGRTLLGQYGNDDTGRTWWMPPGGGMEPGEDDLATARRELHEELGRDDLVVGQPIGHRGGTFHMNGWWLTQYERWYLCRTDHFEVDADVVASVRAEGIRAMRWWSADEMRAEGIDTAPRQLHELLNRIAAGDIPDADTPLGA